MSGPTRSSDPDNMAFGIRSADHCGTARIGILHAERGFSITELMIALLIAMIILVAVVQVFTTSRSTYQMDEGLARVQENARFAMDFLSRDIRMAGYLGCNSKLSSSNIGNIVDPPSDALSFSPEGIRGYRHTCATSCTGALGEWSPPLPADYFSAGQVRAGSDVIIIERAADFGAHLTGNTVPDNANVQIIATAAAASEIAAGDILVVSDCKAADIFRATNKSSSSGKITIAHSQSNPGNTTNFLTNKYGNDAQLMKMVSRAYYIGTGTSGEPALMRKELVNIGGTAQLQAQELVEGVETMRALYGEDTSASGTPGQYVAPASVTNWAKVVSVKFGFVVRTPGVADATTDTTTYDLLGDTSSALDNFDPTDDQRRRRVFNATVRIRNH